MAGDLTATAYSDGTPAIAHTLRRDGKRSAVVDAAGTHSYEYANPGGAFSRETITGGIGGRDALVAGNVHVTDQCPYKRRGHLFQGRYKALLADPGDGPGAYFRTVADYIHLNPARAGLLRVKGGGGKNGGELAHELLWKYRWSSCPLYRGWKKGRPRWLVTDRVLGEHGIAVRMVSAKKMGELKKKRKKLEGLA